MMTKRKKGNPALRLLRVLYIKLFRIHDTPQKVALGVGVGVFLGNMPGMGPIAAIFMAFVLRINRAATLLASLVTNTWLSFLTILLSIKAGSSIMGVKWQDVYADWVIFFKDFRFIALFKSATLKIILPVAVGYLAVSFCFGLTAYLITLVIIKRVKHG